MKTIEVLNQDKDHTYEVTGAYYKEHYAEKMFFGYNVYGKLLNGRSTFLGTFDEEQDAQAIALKINQLARNEIRYEVPESSTDEEKIEKIREIVSV